MQLVDAYETEGRCDSSSDENDLDTEGNSLNMRTDLAEWAVSENVPRNSITKLLKILRKHNMEVPAQASTLLQKPRNLKIQRKSGGYYVYFGLEKCIQQTLASVSTHEIHTIEISVNIDGLPIYRSKNVSLWPIQCNIVNIKEMTPFVVALYCSTHKPEHLEFRQDFVNELKDLMQNGISIGVWERFG